MTVEGSWERMALFTRVVRSGSVTAAAEQLGVAKSTVSAQLAALERGVGVPLLVRTPHGVRPTEAGRRMLRHAERLLGEAQAALDDVRGDPAEPTGTLRVSTPSGMVDLLLAPLLGGFLHRHPAVHLDVVATDVFLDLQRTDIDVAFRFGRAPDGDVIARTLGTFEDVICAAPACLAEHGTPDSVAELEGHRWIGFAGFGPMRQTLPLVDPADGRRHSVEIECRVRTSHGPSVKGWTLAGLGLCRMPRFLVDAELADGRLVRVLPALRLDAPSLYAVHLRDRARRPVVRALLDHLKGSAPMNPPERRRRSAA